MKLQNRILSAFGSPTLFNNEGGNVQEITPINKIQIARETASNDVYRPRLLTQRQARVARRSAH